MFAQAIVGLGPAGIFTLATLPEDQLANTLVIERSVVSGDLSSHYSSVIANISKADFVNAFKLIPKWSNQTFPELDAYEDTHPPKLADTCKVLRRLVTPDISKAHYHTAEVSNFIQTDNGWTIVTATQTYQAKKVFLCTGANPKTLDLPLPAIPLSIALTPSQLANTISPKDTIVLFGTSHSGTLVLRNLKDLGCEKVYAVYKGKTPFDISPDGKGEGLKMEAATIAREIAANAWGPFTPTLISYNDFATLYRTLTKAQTVIYAIGFEARSFTYTNTVGVTTPIDGNTPNIYGFGIGRPRPYTAPDGKQYPDIGFGGFIKTIQLELPIILSL